MTECPLEHHAGFSWMKEEPVEHFASHLSIRGKRVLDRLLVLLPSHLKTQPASRSQFPSALLFSICDAFQFDQPDGFPGQNDPSVTVLPSVLNKLRDWRLLDQDHRYSNGGIHKLALDLAEITDEDSVPTSSNPNRLRMRWVSSDSPSESQDRGSPSPTPPLPSPQSGFLDSAHQCAHAFLDLNELSSDAGHASLQVDRLGTPDSEDASAVVVSPRHRSVSGFRSGCSACRHLRLSDSSSTLPSPRIAHTPLSDVGHFNMDITNPAVSSARRPKPNVHHTSPRKTKQEKHKLSLSMSHVDENLPPLTKPTAAQRGLGVSFPRQRTHSPRISNALLPRDPLSPVAASVIQQRPTEPSHLSKQARAGDKRTTSHRAASADLRSSMANVSLSPNRASPNDLHPPTPTPTRAQSFSYTPTRTPGRSCAAVVPKLSSNAAVGPRSSERLPSWTRTHLEQNQRRLATTTSSPVKPTLPHRSSATPAFPLSQLLPFQGVRSRLSSPSIPRPLLPPTPSQTHKHASSVGALPSQVFRRHPTREDAHIHNVRPRF